MPRRAHHKSRKGCVECKRRHIKCDEKRPICSNCTSSERNCNYAIDGEAFDNPPPSAASRSCSSQPQSSAISPNDQQELSEIDQPVNMKHFQLFYHLSTETVDTFRLEFEDANIPFSMFLKEMVSAPYLMNELLALAAIHQSILDAKNKPYYLRQSTELQTHALSIFNAMKPQVNAETCVPLLLFSSVIGLHEMCKTLIYREVMFEPFMDKFLRYISLHQGVRAITGGSWHILGQSFLGPLLKRAETNFSDDASSSELYSRLQNLTGSMMDIDQEDRTSCQQAISSLQSVSGATHPHMEGRISVNSILAWPVIICQGYTNMLERREPHALIILAYYGVLLHSRRDMWMFGDGGAFMVNLISEHLGLHWAESLLWPVQAVS